MVQHVLDEHIELHCHDSVSKWVMEIEEKGKIIIFISGPVAALAANIPF